MCIRDKMCIRDRLYPDAYEFDEYVEVSDEVYEALCEFENEEEAYQTVYVYA